MDYKDFEKISSIFVKSTTFSGIFDTHGQHEGYRKLGGLLSSEVEKLHGSDALKSTVRHATENVTEYLSGIGVEKTPILISDIDEMAEEKIREWLPEPSYPRLQVLTSLLGAYLFETRQIQTDRKGIKSDVASTAIDAEFASYVSWKNQEATVSILLEKANAASEVMDQAVEKSLQTLATKNQELSDALIAMQKTHSEAVASVDEANSNANEMRSQTEEFMQFATAGFTRWQSEMTAAEAQLTALQEGIATISAKTLWDQRARGSNVAFWISSFILGILLIGLPALAIYKLDATLSILRHIGEATMQGLPTQPTDTQLAIAAISRVVVITLPIALYLWVIKLVVRFNLRSLVLVDDARQRHTMMDTYFHLIAKQAAAKEDRALILAALFRPSPGQGPDNVDPPAFTDLINKGISK